MSNVIFISKDALNKHALPTYGNSFWKTPNIDELAKKGTIFNRHYTAAGSTAMAFTAMALGDYCYKTGRKKYKNEESLNGDTLFDKADKIGYECHIVWDDSYTEFAKKHFRCEGINTTIHGLKGIKQQETRHIKGTFDDVSFNWDETNKALELIKNELLSIKNNAKRDIFLWMHLPHVMRGRQGYGSDIDVFDQIIGIAREIFGDETISISADHGHMNGWKNKYHYGYDVGEEAICIPLVCPRINGESHIDYPTSTIQMFDIQPKRKIAIIKGNYKYCFDKEGKKEYLYDLEFDKEENHNLIHTEFYDTDRFLWYSTAQCFYYPRWKESVAVVDELRKIKNTIWKNGSFFEELYNKIIHRIKCLYLKIKLAKPSNNIRNIGK